MIADPTTTVRIVSSPSPSLGWESRLLQALLILNLLWLIVAVGWEMYKYGKAKGRQEKTAEIKAAFDAIPKTDDRGSPDVDDVA